MERDHRWRDIVETRLDRCLAIKIGLEMERIEAHSLVSDHPFCNSLIDKALYSTYRDIEDLGDNGLSQKMIVHIELLKHILKVV